LGERMSSLSVDLRESRVLLMENNKMMRRLVRDMLLSFRIKQDNIVEVEGVDDALEFIYSRTFDIVITEFFLGDLDGGDFAHHIRRDANCINRKVPILLTTSSPNHEKVLQVLEAGINGVLAKPIAPSALYFRIFSILSRPRPFVVTKDYIGPSRSIQRLESIQRLSRSASVRRQWRSVYRANVTYPDQPNKSVAHDPFLL